MKNKKQKDTMTPNSNIVNKTKIHAGLPHILYVHTVYYNLDGVIAV